MKPIELKPGLSIDGDHAYISCPRIASIFINKIISDKKEYTKLVGIYDSSHFKIEDCIEEESFKTYTNILIIHKSLIHEELKPVEGECGLGWWDHSDKQDYPRYIFVDALELDILHGEPHWHIVKASELTLNLSVEKLNLLVNWSQE